MSFNSFFSLQQTMDFVDIQCGSQPCKGLPSVKNVRRKCGAIETNDQLESDVSSVEIKIESISSEDDESMEIVSSSQSTSEARAAAKQPAIDNENVTNRPFLNSSNPDQQRSTCLPSTSNLPMLVTTPIETPNSILTSSSEISAEEIKQEHRDNAVQKMILNEWHADNCGAKMEDVPAEHSFMEMKRKDHGTPSTSQANTDRSVPSKQSKPESLKRQNMDNDPNETTKRQKTIEEIQNNLFRDFLFPLSEPGSNIDRDIVFACFYCHSQSNFYVETFAEVYEHWRSSHMLKSFRFIAFKKAACFFCGKFDVFSNLRNHHKHEHHAEIFIAVTDEENKSKCGLCHKMFSLSEMVVHFKSEHDPMHYIGIPSPVCFTQGELEQLLSLNMPQPFSHGNTDSFGEIEAFMCGHCNVTKNVSEISFLQHLEEDAFQFKCSECQFLGNTIDETVQHESSVHYLEIDKQKHLHGLMGRLDRHFLRTRVIFTNGLVLWKHNILNSTFDDHNVFWPFKEQLVKQKFATPSLPTAPSKKPESEKVLRTKQLAKQMANALHLHISGIHLDVNRRKGLLNTFLLICEAIGVNNLTEDDIQDIYRCRSNAVIVRLQTLEMKKQILNAWIKAAKTSLPPTCNVLIQPELTPFFLNLWNLAKNAQKKNRIHSFWMSDDGLVVKPNKNSHRKIIVWSKDDLTRCISGGMK